MPLYDEQFKDIESILVSNQLNDSDKKNLERLVKNYKKDLSRFDKVMRQSDKMSIEISNQKESLERLSKKLSKYLSPQIYDMIFSNDQQEVKLESSRKKLTVFFSDIVGFTSTTENLEPEELTTLLNQYLTEMSNIALKYGATIDKYIGDAILIFFGDPHTLGQTEDAVACVKMSLEMLEKIEELKYQFSNDGIVSNFQVRIGINTGFCTVGNFGSADRMDYTIIGSPVNLAARLQSASEANQMLISHETYSLIKHAFNCTRKKDIDAKGFDKPIPTYQVDGYRNNKESYVFEVYKRGLEIKLDSNLLLNDKKEVIALFQKLIHDLKD